MSKVYYNQCKLKKENRYEVSYIPHKYAKQGNVIKIKQDDETWEDGWIVEEVYSELVEEKLLPDSYSEIKAHRKKTGDAMPKFDPS